ncbi:TetR/AcrR family transcriptional regulator [Cellulomonas chengniuliangii]|uniref:TetR/AcrR family transcriptional regulator n=1 Tax=Cellulomonas chengniuliangii TaxID=2968084 RepID=A0ABY5KXG0_9CELL|nr:TetR/AcrR family transcriptional regulator [Cellulomonas chengniuliangii]MCC2308896.1 TetR/AcrR family transcriptional regulator [Cellulomonas chengniuliangii]MCC2317125.1 TetR/AcrR family transcriptional regulator [Cellulomonas chengniuliangii]UUI74364.1 TetR/AcrR family transcriptional regulator [Cellulomonas chengniuliangii]
MNEEEVRARVVQAAHELYYARGIQAVGMDELRAAAGVSLKRLYAVFPSKSDIVLAVLRHRHQLWVDGIEARVEQADSPRDRLLAIFDYLSDWFADEAFRGCGFINAFAELGGTSTAVTEETRAHKESFQRYVAGLVAEAGGAPELAAQLAILAEGAQTTAAIAGTSAAAATARRAAEVLIDAEAPGAASGRQAPQARRPGRRAAPR